MIEILLMIIASLLAAKRGRKGRRLFVPKVTHEEALGTLAASDVQANNIADTLDEEAFLISADLVWSIRDLTATEGPIVVGICHSDYAASEIEEYLENAGSWDRGDLINQEISGRGRRIRTVGSFSGNSTEETLNDGKPIRTKCGWKLITGQTLKFWAYNKSGAALTTGAEVVVEGQAFFRPL